MKNTAHEWSSGQLFAKAQLYAEAMLDNQGSSWQFGLWSAFVLEMLVRASVANVSPVLLAESRDWNNLLHALGKPSKKPKFVPKSASITELIQRVEDLSDGFSREHSNFCASHVARRNSEVHSGNMPFENLGTSSWLPMFYTVCDILALEIGESLETLLGDDDAKRAREEIDALKDDTANNVKGTISAHKTVWDEKTKEEKEQARKQAITVALRHYGHRVSCPACESDALLQGKAAGIARRDVDGDGIVERQAMQPESFSCVACGLKISGYSKLIASGLGDTFISTSHYDALEYFEVDLDEHIRSMMEDDNNEY